MGYCRSHNKKKTTMFPSGGYQAGSQVVLEEDYDENYKPNEEGWL